jgi:hypothetical protein
LYRDKYDNSISEAWALGGSVTYTSGYLENLFRIGAAAYTSQPLYAPDGRDGTLLLKPGQEGYTVLGQIYGEVKFTDELAGAFGRKEYNTPYIQQERQPDDAEYLRRGDPLRKVGRARRCSPVALWRRLHYEDQGTEFR